MVVRILCNIQNMIYNTEHVLYFTMCLYIYIYTTRSCPNLSWSLYEVLICSSSYSVSPHLHGYLNRVSHYIKFILYVYQFSILTWDGQNDDIIRLLSSQSDDWSQTSPAKDRFYQFHSDFRILFIIPRTFLSSTFKLFRLNYNLLYGELETVNHLPTQRDLWWK